MMTSLIEYELKYVSKADGSFDVVMPDNFDSEKHTLELYFRRVSEEPYGEDPEFFNRYMIPMEGYRARIMGDANKDGKVNIADASLVLKYIARWEGVAIDTELANMNGDSSINIVDVSRILKTIAGWKMV